MERGDTHLCRNEAAPALSFVPKYHNNDEDGNSPQSIINYYHTIVLQIVKFLLLNFHHMQTSRLQSVLIPGTQLAITANTEGSAVIWEDLTPPQEGSPII